MESLKRSKASDCTVTGSTTGTPLEELLELEELEEDELLLESPELLEELEETARLWLMTTPRPPALSDARIDELRARFDAPW